MKVENDNKEPVTDLRLALGYSNHGIQRRLSNDLGAGANAASRIDMTFVATDPLSELVWSPQKGPSPSLRCTDCSFADKKHSLVWGAGPSCVVLSPQQMNTSAKSSNDKPGVENNLNNSISTFHDLNANVSNSDNSDRSAWNDDGMEMCQEKQTDNDHSFQGNASFVEDVNTKGGESYQNIIEKNNLVHSKDVNNVFCPYNNQEAEIAEAVEDSFPDSRDERKPHLARVEPLFKDPATEARDVGSGDKMSRMEIVLASGVQNDNICETSEYPEKSLTSPGRTPVGSASLMDKKEKRKMGGISSLWPLEKLEATAENDLQTLIGDNECIATSKISGSESSSEVDQENFQQDHKKIFPEKTSADKHSPTNSRIRRYRKKGKEKTLSDGDVKKMMSNEDGDSHESVESCNSAGLSSRGKKRWGFEQRLIVGSKRVKRKMYDSPCSSSFVKQDSSFMNWIANMMKGFFKSKDETPSLALTFPTPHQSHEGSEKIFDINNKNQDLGCKNTGFQSIFQSMHSTKTKVQVTATQNENYQAGLELSDQVRDIDATPITCHGENFNLHKVFPLSNEKFKEPASGGQVGELSQPKVSSMNSAENKNSCNLAVGMEKNRASSSSSFGKLNDINTENIDSIAPSEEKTIHNIDYKGNCLRSLWITRFTPKSSSSLSNQDTSGVVDCMKHIPSSPFNVNVSSNLKIVKPRQQCTEEPVTSSSKELPNSATEIDASFGFNKFTVQHNRKLKCKVSPFLSSSKLKDSDEIASTFARRLDALKNIIPSSVSDNTASSIITCFFCGRKGHHLQCCPEIRDNEIENLQRYMKSSNKLKDFTCVCIRCFEPNHWAKDCPKQSADRSSLANLSGLQCYSRFDEIKKYSDENQGDIDAVTSCMAKDPSNNYGVTADKIRSNKYVDKTCVASSCKENKLKKNQITAWGNFINLHVSDMPKAIFNAVKMLRLTRSDILKWMSSKISISHLEGFFLRLRLGKWEEGLGGTGYHVACITGAHQQSTEQNSKSSISVNVGRTKCLVESHYISNHDFLEDELTTWWRATTKSGGKIPSHEELTMKVKERRLLGF